MAQQKSAKRPASALKKVRFTFKAEGAKEVVLTGDFTQWSETGIPLIPIDGGEWMTELSLPPGEYQYRLRVDGQWRDDPASIKRIPNPFGTENCVLTVS